MLSKHVKINVCISHRYKILACCLKTPQNISLSWRHIPSSYIFNVQKWLILNWKIKQKSKDLKNYWPIQNDKHIMNHLVYWRKTTTFEKICNCYWIWQETLKATIILLIQLIWFSFWIRKSSVSLRNNCFCHIYEGVLVLCTNTKVASNILEWKQMSCFY